MPKVKRKSTNQKLREDRLRSVQKKAMNAISQKARRQNLEIRTREQISNTAAHSSRRKHPEVLKAEAAAKKIQRQNIEYRAEEKRRDAEAHCRQRQNQDFRTVEKKRDCQARCSRRRDPQVLMNECERKKKRREDGDFRATEKMRDATARNTRRQISEYRTPEKQRDTTAHQRRRQNSKLLEIERVAKRIRRQQADLRGVEQIRDVNARRKQRINPQILKAEAETKKKRRKNTNFRAQERRRDSAARAIIRKIKNRRQLEQAANTKNRKSKRRLLESNFEALLEAFEKKICCAPNFVCSCCGNLWYQDSTTKTSNEKLKNLGFVDEEIVSILYVNQDCHRLCSTCSRAVSRKSIPRLALANGLGFPKIPSVLMDLSPLEERLVAPRIPFMQLRSVGSEGQSILRGNVVNVENDLDVCAQVLPRRFDEMSTVQVQLMRRLKFRSPYMYETIRPKRVYDAAKYLVESDLYAEEGIALSEDWNRYKEGDTLNFITEDMSTDSTGEASTCNDVNEDTESDLDLDSNLPQENANNDNVGAEETLFFRENDVDNSGIRIAPGEGKIPIPLFLDPNAEVLSFPSIYAGRKRKFKDGLRLSYTDICKSELRRYDRRACRPAKLLYSFKRSFNEKLYQAMQICMRKKAGKVNASTLRRPGYIQNLLRKDNGYAVFKKLRSSPSFWKEKTKSVLAMLRTLGKFSFFITLSAAETRWTELKIILMEILKHKNITEEEAKNIPLDEIREMIRNDPVTCIRHFDHRYRALLYMLLKPKGGIFRGYKLKDYFSRIEFQMRGSPHSHGLYWLENAPNYDENDEVSVSNCVQFIDHFITCQRDEEGEMAKLICYQLHKHSHTCKKMRKQGETCRFSFPKPPMSCTMILKPLPKDINLSQRKRAAELFARIKDKMIEWGTGFKEVIEHDALMASFSISIDEYILAIRSSITRPTVFLKRSTNACFINGYNRQLLLAWKANIDIQFPLDTYACAKYCVGYILKSEGGTSKLLQRATKEVRRGNTALRDKLKKFASILINGSEICAQEAAAFILAIPNTTSSRQDIYINTGPPEERVGILRPTSELEALEGDSEDVYSKGLLDHYVQRPQPLELICLADFASWYEFTKNIAEKDQSRNLGGEGTEAVHEEFQILGSPSCSFSLDKTESHPETDSADQRKFFHLFPSVMVLEDGSGSMRRRTCPKIIRFRHYGKKDDPANYYREQLMLFVPWRDEQKELLSINSEEVANARKRTILDNSSCYYKDREIDDDSLCTLLEDVEVEEPIIDDADCNVVENGFDEAEYTQENPMNAMEEASTTRDSLAEQFRPPGRIDNSEYIKMMRTLNEKQRRFVFNTLHQFEAKNKPFYYFLSGGAGVGKSQALTAIVQSCLRMNEHTLQHPEQVCVIVGAPTGKAAFNVFGMTLHSIFKLPPNQYGGRICDLSDGAINTLRVKLRHVKLFIIDEISMVSVKHLYEIDQRLRQVFDTSEAFGGRSVIVVGHLRQLPPVAAFHVFKPPTHIPLGGCVGNHLWEKFSLFELDEIMRQKGEYAFCKALNNMAEGCMDEHDMALIRSRRITGKNIPPNNAIHLFATNKECQEHNAKVHNRLQHVEFSEGSLSTAHDTVQGAGSKTVKMNLLERAKAFTTQQSHGLLYQTNLQVGGEYFISTNQDVSDGLFNGVTGSLKKIEYGKTHSGRKIPTAAWMDFRQPLIGSKARAVTSAEQRRKKLPLNWVKIGRVRKNLTRKTENQKGPELVRIQIPLVAANGMTITKSQGSSLPIVVVCVKVKVVNEGMENESRKNSLSREYLYVACSRATSLQGLYIDGDLVAPDAPGENDPVSLEIARLRVIPFQFSLKFLQDFGDEYNKIYFHNVESVLPHFDDLMADHCAMASDFLVLVEPRLLAKDTLRLQNHSIILRENCKHIRNSEGALILKQNNSGVVNGPPSVLTHFTTEGHCIIITIRIAEVKFIIVYKHPKFCNNLFVNTLRDFLQRTKGKVIVVGDTNMDLKKAESFYLISLFQEYNLEPSLNVNDASTKGGSHLDCCYSNVENLQAWFYISYFSYHKPICIVWKK